MGFYGNITNQSKTQFQFDRTYPNRYTMDQNVLKDGVYAGRYVLVEYDSGSRNTDPGSGTGVDQYKIIYQKGDKYFNASNGSNEVVKGDVEEGQLVNVKTIYDSGSISTSAKLMKCEGFIVGTNVAKFTLITTEEDNYTRNYQVDTKEYGAGRGWDSTVWQKTYTNGTEKYVMIAELNSVVPTFTLTADAPTMAPIMPHFDKNSTNVLYRMHYQPQWGFRTKSAKNYQDKSVNSEGKPAGVDAVDYSFSVDNVTYPSDEQTEYKRYEYDLEKNQQTVLFFNEKAPDGNKWATANEGSKIDAAIYFNRDGFDPENIVYSADKKKEAVYQNWNDADVIKVEPTGQSGHSYNEHSGDPGFSGVQPDTQELSIMLPSLGNNMAKIWNLVYGDEEINDGRKRNLDIDWDSTEGIRAVNLQNDGYSFDEKKLPTVAGVINSVHDLMGMIVVKQKKELTQTEIDNTSTGNIYYFETDGTFRRKHEIFDYTPLNYNYVAVSVNADTYKPETYYTKSGNNYVRDEAGFNSGTTYYEKRIPDVTYNRINLADYKKDTYYYKENSGNYRFETRDAFQKDRQYYNIADGAFVEQALHTAYKKGVYYYKVGDNYLRDNAETFTTNRSYYALEGSTSHYLFAPGVYAYQTPDGEFHFPDSNAFNGNNIYFTNYRLVNNQLYGDIINLVNYKSEDKIYFKYDSETGDYTLLTTATLTESDVKDAEGKDVKYYIPKFSENILDPFYEPNVYYYAKDKDYILSTESNKSDSIKYLKPVNNKITLLNDFYAPNTYYILENGIYKKDKSNALQKNVQYYEKVEYYIISDEDEIFSKGSVWNTNTLRVPCTIELGTRTSKFEMQVMDGFARHMNTIHGLILKLNYMLEAGDLETRDIETAQGAINQIKDIIEKFDELTPGQFVIVNDIGQMAGSDYTTAQAYSSKDLRNDSKNKELAEAEDRWIYLNVNKEKKLITAEHKFTSANNTADTIDMNSRGDTFEIVTPIVDTMGHTVAKNTQTVTLPYGFKTIKTNGVGSAVTDPSSNQTDDIVADNSKDTLTINSANKWVKIANSNNTMSIGHEVHGFDTAAADSTDLNNPALDTITIKDISYDEAGHIKADKAHVYILPYGFKTVKPGTASTATADASANTTSVVADSTQDALTIAPSNKWIKLAGTAGSDTISVGHQVNTITTTAKTTNVNGNGDTIVIYDITNDAAGHITANQPNTYTLPYGYKQVSVTPYGGSATKVIANNTQDNLNFNSLNKWIELTGTDSSNTITVKHQENNVSQTAGAVDLNSVKTFNIQEYTFDTAGHIASSIKRTYTMPNALKTVSITNQGTSVGTITPDSQTDTLILNSGNSWIGLEVSGKTATVKHNTLHSSAIEKGAAATGNYTFGSTFKVPTVAIDMAGHTTALSEYAVTLPKPVLKTGTSGNVLVGLSLNDTLGEFTVNAANIGTLNLIGYNGTRLSATDTLNDGLKKLAKGIDDLSTSIEADIEEIQNTLNTVDKFISEEQALTFDSTSQSYMSVNISYPEGFTADNTVVEQVAVGAKDINWSVGKVDYVVEFETNNIKIGLLQKENYLTEFTSCKVYLRKF